MIPLHIETDNLNFPTTNEIYRVKYKKLISYHLFFTLCLILFYVFHLFYLLYGEDDVFYVYWMYSYVVYYFSYLAVSCILFDKTWCVLINVVLATGFVIEFFGSHFIQAWNKVDFIDEFCVLFLIYEFIFTYTRYTYTPVSQLVLEGDSDDEDGDGDEYSYNDVESSSNSSSISP